MSSGPSRGVSVEDFEIDPQLRAAGGAPSLTVRKPVAMPQSGYMFGTVGAALTAYKEAAGLIVVRIPPLRRSRGATELEWGDDLEARSRSL
jgi:hypothetical protein